LVLNVRDIEASHRFWVDVVGFKQVGELEQNSERRKGVKMRFYSGERNGETHHHDLALVESANVPEPPKEYALFGGSCAVNHIAITFPDRDSWLQQLEHVRAMGVKFDSRVNHGMTHSLYVRDPNGYGVELLYDLPREVWGGDIDAALNYVEVLSTEGEEALVDTEEVPVFNRA
ncbi:MAG: VOC family protein, partial [Chromatiales bacterium]|nr:VOC family protein [Chromatiales bacterium]